MVTIIAKLGSFIFYAKIGKTSLVEDVSPKEKQENKFVVIVRTFVV